MKNSIPILFLLLAVACGGSQRPADQARVGLATALTATNAARDAFVAWDKEHQSQLVEAATSLEDGKARLAAYRARRQTVSAAFVTAYASIAGAATALAVAEAEGDTARVVALAKEALVAVMALRDAVAHLKGGG